MEPVCVFYFGEDGRISISQHPALTDLGKAAIAVAAMKMAIEAGVPLEALIETANASRISSAGMMPAPVIISGNEG